MTKFTEDYIKECRIILALGYDLDKDFPAALDEIERLRAAKQEVEGFLRDSEKEVLRLKAIIYKEVGTVTHESYNIGEQMEEEIRKEVEKMSTCLHGNDPLQCVVCRNR